MFFNQTLSETQIPVVDVDDDHHIHFGDAMGEEPDFTLTPDIDETLL